MVKIDAKHRLDEITILDAAIKASLQGVEPSSEVYQHIDNAFKELTIAAELAQVQEDM